MKTIFRGFVTVIAAIVFVQPAFALVSNESATMSKKVTINEIATSTSIKLVVSDSKNEASAIKASTKDYVEGEILVKYKSSKINLDTTSGKAKAVNFENTKSLENIDKLEKSNISILRISDGMSVEEKVTELESDTNVEYAEPNYRRYPALISSNDTYRNLIWGLDNTGQTVNSVTGLNDADIDAPEAWSINEGTNATNSIIVAVIDSGVAYNHPDLLSNMWNGINCKDENGNALGNCNYGYDFEDNDKTPLPTNSSHGTHVAGTIASVKNNNKGIIGVAPNAKIMALKSSLSISEVVKATDFATKNGAKIINASYAGNTFSQAEFDAINRFKAAGGILVAAAGNESLNNNISQSYPSDYNLDNIISVAATTQNDTLATFSNYGSSNVDVGAPGTNIYSTESEITLLNESFSSISTPNIPSGWTKGGTSNNWGTYTLDDGSFWGNVLYGDLAFPYANNANTNITSTAYNLNGAGGAIIDFWARCDNEYGPTLTDYMVIQISADGVNFTGLNLGGVWGTTNGEFNEWYLDDDSDATNAALYHFESITIPQQFLTSNFKLRLRWVTNSSNNNFDGCLVDDVKISKFSNGSDELYGYQNGTSMATPHVAGLAALLYGYNPTLSPTQVKNVILTSGDSLPSLSGRTVSGKRINAEKALRAVNPAKAITSFTVTSQVGTTTINEAARTISLTVPSGTNVTALVPTIAQNGASVSPQSGTPQNFTAPVQYTVTAADSSTQVYVVTVTVTPAPDTTAPVISLNGQNPVNINVGNAFVDPGATAVDNIDGVVTVTPSGVVDTTTIGAYTIIYTATDSAFNTASVTRTVNVNANIPTDTTKPILTLIGSSTIHLTTGENYIDSGAAAFDETDGNITAEIILVNPVNTSIVGVYTITYNVADAAGNSATEITRTVEIHPVVDTTPPTITLSGSNPINLTVGAVFNEPGFTASDNIDGNISGLVTIGGDSVNTNTPGAYTITYNVTDAAGNTALEVTRTINVSDADAPVFSGIPENYNLEATSVNGAELSYVLPTANDDVDGSVSVTCTPQSGVTLPFGNHTIECSATDSAGNEATASFTVTVLDTTGPVISNIPSNQTIDITSGASAAASYIIPTGEDAIDGVTSVACSPESGSMFPIGVTTVDCVSSDTSGNQTNKTFKITINLVDETLPIITLNGSTSVSIEFGETFVDPGATAVDNIDGVITDEITVTGSVNKNMAGTYTLTYTVVDNAGNEASITRTVIVNEYIDTVAPVLTLLGGPSLNITTGSLFTDPGVTALDNVDGNITGNIASTGSVDTAIVGTYVIVYTVTDTAGNTSTQNRTVIVSNLTLSTVQHSAVTANSVTVSWTTSHPATSRIVWDTISRSLASTTEAGPTNYSYTNSTTEDGNLVLNHSVTISGLSPLTTYFFRPVSHASPEVLGAEISVTTISAPSSGGSGGGGGGSSSGRNTTPLYSVQINNNSPQTNTLEVNLTIARVTNANQMQISNSSDFASATWLTFEPTYKWTLSANPGIKTVFIRYGKNGKVIGKAQDSITLIEKNIPALPSVNQPTLQGQVLGISTQKFTSQILPGSTSADVTELQKVLIAEGYLKIPLPTGFYGPMTEAAVRAYQRANGVEQSGTVGQSTLAILNKTTQSALSNEQRQLLIKQLQAKVLELMEQLKALAR